MKFLLIFVVVIFVTGCLYQTEDGIVFGKPDYWKRDIEVTEIDLKILERTDELLSERSWTRGSMRICSEPEKLSLYCALEKASIEVNGEYKHRQAALQEMRFAIDDHYRSYWSEHRLVDFNNYKLTTLSDVQKVIAVAKGRVKSKLKHYKSTQPATNASTD